MYVFVFVPVFSSISLDLLPERAATLMVYEDVVEIVSGLQGKMQCMYGLIFVYLPMHTAHIFLFFPKNTHFRSADWFKAGLYSHIFSHVFVSDSVFHPFLITKIITDKFKLIF